MYRKKVNKRKSAKSYKHHASHMKRVNLRPVMRGGIRF